MKRTLCTVMAVLLAVSLMLSAVSCTLFETCEFANEAVKAVSAADNVGVNMKTEVYITGETEEMITKNAALTMSKLQTTEPIFTAKSEITLFEEVVPADIYFENATYYVVTENDSVQISASDAGEAFDFLNEWKRMHKTFSDTAIKNAALTKNEDGSKTAEILLDAGEFASLYEGLLAEWHAEIIARYVGTYESSGMTATDTKAKITVDANGKLLTYELVCRMAIECVNAAGETKNFSALLTCVADYTDGAMVTAPEGYLDFEVSDGKKINPYTFSKKAIEHALALNDWNAVMTMEVIMNIMGAEIAMRMDSTVLATDVQTNDPVFRTTSKMESMEITETENVYFADGYYYVDSETEGKIKYTTEQGQESYDAITDIRDLVKVLSESQMASATLTKNEDGSKTVTVMVPAAQAGDLYGEVFGDMEDFESVSDVDVTIVIDKAGNLVSYSVGGSFSINSQGYTLSVPTTYSVAFNDIGTVVTPEPMAGYESYQLPAEKNEDTFAAINEAIENFLSADEFNLYYLQESYTDLAGTTTTVIQEAEVSATDLNSSAKYRYQLATQMLGMSFTEDVYYENGNFYITSPILGDSVKVNATDAPTYNILAIPAAVIQTIPEALSENAETDYTDGVHCFYAELDEAQFSKMFAIYEAQITEESLGYPISEKTFAGAYLEAMADDAGHLIYFNVGYYYDIDIEVAGQIYDVYATVDAYFETDMFSDVTVEAPENHENFTEYNGEIVA